MTERPIFMRDFEVRAILDGTKTMTRRPVKPQPLPGQGITNETSKSGFWLVSKFGTKLSPYKCPYGQPGDRLWVRETINATVGQDAFYVADERELHTIWGPNWQDERGRLALKVVPSTNMPRWASRITLEVTGIRVERVQDVSEADARAEGAIPNGLCSNAMRALHGGSETLCAFEDLWDSLNARRGYGWNRNPWVWVIEFRRVGDAQGEGQTPTG